MKLFAHQFLNSVREQLKRQPDRRRRQKPRLSAGIAGAEQLETRDLKSAVSAAMVTQTPTAASPAITANPVNHSVDVGLKVVFTAGATGSPTPTVQWQVKTNGAATFTNLAGATSPTLSFTVSASQNGNQYRAVFTNSSGKATTTAATLTALSPHATFLKTFGDGIVSDLATINGKTLVSVHYLQSNDFQLWRTDGTVAGTTLLHDFGQGISGSVEVLGTVHGNVLLAVGVGGYQIQNIQVFRSDGTATGTVPIRSFSNSVLTILPTINGNALCGIYDATSHSGSLWSVNSAGTVADMTQVASLGNLGTSSYFFSSPINGLGTVNGTATGTALFSVGIFNGGLFPVKMQLWGSNGKTATMLHDFGSGSAMLTNVGTANGVGLISAEIGTDFQLWGTSGSVGTTQKLHDFGKYAYLTGMGTTSTGIAEISVNFCNSSTMVSDEQLWGTKGTPGLGTYLVKDFGAAVLQPVGVVGGVIDIDVLNPLTSDNQIWDSNGFASGTLKVHDFPKSHLVVLTNVNGSVLFGVHTVTAVPTDDLWAISGSASSLSMIHSFPGNSDLYEVATVNGIALLGVHQKLTSTTTDDQLWWTNGTASAIGMIHDFGGFGELSFAGAYGGKVYIGAFNSSTDFGALWDVNWT